MSTTDLLQRAEKALEGVTDGPWEYEDERYSSRCVIGIKPRDDRWLAHAQPSMNGERNGRFIAQSRTLVPELVEALRTQIEARQEFESIAHDTITERDRLAAENAKLWAVTDAADSLVGELQLADKQPSEYNVWFLLRDALAALSERVK